MLNVFPPAVGQRFANAIRSQQGEAMVATTLHLQVEKIGSRAAPRCLSGRDARILRGKTQQLRKLNCGLTVESLRLSEERVGHLIKEVLTQRIIRERNVVGAPSP